MRPERGLALILVIGVLGLLALLGSAFAILSRLERLAAAQRVLASQALLLSRSGIEDTLARIAMGQDTDTYGGEDWAGDGWDAYDQSQEVYGSGVMNTADCPVQQALRPSFFVREGTGKPKRIPVDGRERGYSGRLAQGTYALKVAPQAGIFLNGSDAPVLRRILGHLAEALDRENGGADDGVPSDQAAGWLLADSRPSPGGWKDLEQVRQWAKTQGALEPKILALLPYVTARAWVDTRTLKPDAASMPTGTWDWYHTWSELKVGAPFNPLNAPYLSRPPTRGGPVLEPRAPVNLAWARRRWPVLVALTGGLKGLYLDELTARDGDNGADSIGSLKAVELVLNWGLASDPCRRVASRLASYTGPLGTWDEWNDWCNTVTSSDLGSNQYPTVPAMRSLLKANFNPNTRLNKLNPNRSLWHLVDKQDLLVHSTEFILEPVHAHEVESVGRMLTPSGRLLAARTLRSGISGPNVARLSTQRELVCSDLGSLERSGDETGVRIPGVDSPFLSVSKGPGGVYTWGQDLPGLSAKGAGVQSYPEPCVDPGTGLTLSPADYDGSLQSATLETGKDDTYAVNSAPNDMKMLSRFTADLDLAVSDAAPARPLADPRWRNQPDSKQAPLTNSVMDPALPNTLHPDGCYAERDRAPGYFDKDNANGIHGLMSFWLKPSSHFGGMTGYLDDDPTLLPGAHEPWRSHQLVKWTNFFTGTDGGIPDGGSPDQFFGVFHIASGSLVCQFDSDHTSNDLKNEHRFESFSDQPRPHRWRLLTLAWDLRCPDTGGSPAHDTGEMVRDDGTGTWGLGWMNAYPGNTGNNPLVASDLTDDDRYGNGTVDGSWPHLIFLGRRGYLQELCWDNSGIGISAKTGMGADATLDEFVIYDFGGAGPGGVPAAPAASLASPVALAQKRFREGRYYKESSYVGLELTSNPANRAAEWFSAPIDLGGGRLRSLHWTQVVPRGLRAPLPALGKPGIDGDPGENGRIDMDLSDLAGTGYVQDTSRSPFRLHAVFRPNLEDLDNTPILDPLALDDVTILYEPKGGPRMLSWGSE